MTDAPTASSRLERQLQILDRLAEAGLEIVLVAERLAKAVEQEVPAVEAAAAVQGLSLASARASRGARQALLLQARLIEGPPAGAGAAAGEEAAAADPFEDEDDDGVNPGVPRLIVEWADGSVRRGKAERVREVVEDVARAEGREREAVEALAREAAERLECDAIYRVMRRSTSEVVAHICRDLGLSPDWPRLAEQAWAQQEMREKVGAPLIPFTPPQQLWWLPEPARRRFGKAAQAPPGPVEPAAAEADEPAGAWP